MLTTYWSPTLSASFNGARQELENAFKQIYQQHQPSAGRLPLTIWEDDQHVYLEAD